MRLSHGSRLLRLALALSPREFREQYAEQIFAEASEEKSQLPIAFDTFAAGCLLRWEAFLRDIMFSCRSLLNSPLVSGICILAIALSIGSNIAVVSIVEGVLLSPLPYPEPGRLVFVSLDRAGQIFPSFLDAKDVASQSRTLTDFGVAKPDGLTLLDQGRHASLRGQMIAGSYLQTLQARAIVGRLLNADDAGKNLIVLNEGAWRRYFGGSTDIIGKSILFDRKTYNVVGIISGTFRDPSPGALRRNAYWVPVDRESLAPDQRGILGDTTIARLRNNTDVNTARVELSQIIRTLSQRYPLNFNAQSSESGVISMQEGVAGPARPLILTLLFAVALVLLIACANVANLLLLRVAGRRRELILRSVLGASASRIVTQLFVESALLSSCGGALGLGIAAFMLQAFSAVGPRFLPRWDNVKIDGTVTIYTLALIVIVTIATGTLPGVFERIHLADRLRSRGPAAASRRTGQLRAVLVTIELALAIAVTLSAGLVLKSFVTLTRVDVGFQPGNLYDVNFGLLPENRYPTADSRSAFITQAIKNIASIPGISAVTVTGALPFSDANSVGFTIPGFPDPRAFASVYAIDANYFATLRIPLLRGRRFGPNDKTSSLQVAIVSATLARRYFGTLDVIGKRIVPSQWSTDSTRAPVREIVGVVGDVRQSLASPPQASIYAPATQLLSYWRFIVRSSSFNEGVGRAIVSAVAQVDRHLPPAEIKTLQSYISDDSVRAQATTFLFSFLALVASALAMGGVYTLSSYTVQQRRQEFGICLALGARTMNLVTSVLARHAWTTVAGVALGIVFSVVFAQVLQRLLFQTSATDGPTFVLTIVLLIVTTAVSALLPTVRIANIDPSKALRYE